MEYLNAENRSIIINDGYHSKEDYPITIRLHFSTLRSIIEIAPGRGWQVSFVEDNTLRDLLAFQLRVIHGNKNLSEKPVDILSFDNIFLEKNIAQGMIFESKRSGSNHKFIVGLHGQYKNIKNLQGGFGWFLVESKDISKFNFKLENEKGRVVSFNGQSFNF